MRYLLLLLILLVIGACVPDTPMWQDMAEWEFREADDSIFLPATIPGCIHTDLLANGLIEDPFFGENEKDLQWIGESTWIYQKSIFPDEHILDKDHQELIFEGLDTYADVFLNDSLILSANNMFRTWKVDVKGILRQGENLMKVVFSPPEEINKERASELAYQLPDNRAFTRKAPYQFGWDWGPKLVTCGIWKPVHLRAWNDFRIDHFHVDYGSINAEPLPVNVRLAIESTKEQYVRVQLFDEMSGKRKVYEKVELKEGMNEILLKDEIEDPELWWPAGLGEAKLYSYMVKVIGSERSDEAHTRFGIREIELIREPDNYGESFYFMINSLAVFMKGANYVPQDNFLPGVDTARYEKLIGSVMDANMNMLRVWGGGVYENDIFYDLCDQHGILVWQDFMFACNMYPGDDAFLENVRQEAIDNITRLSNHPCIALWCGNNEIDEGWHNWGWQQSLGYSNADSTKVWNDYLKIFHDILPAAVEKYDPGTIYWPSSPMTGWGRDEAYTQGDVHYWGVWWGEQPFWMYREKVGRFVSEYGFQGMPSIETIESFSGLRSLDFARDDSSFQNILEAHQKHPRGTELIQKYMAREYIVPEKFEDYVYISQVLQAEGMGQAFYTHRIAQPYCMGTLYWQLNDCWPVTSWAGLDYYGRWKALHYHVKRAYSPLMVKAFEKDGEIFVFAINDHPRGEEVEMLVELIDFNGNIIHQKKEKLEFPPQSNQHVFSMPSPHGEIEDMVFIVRLFQEGEEVSNSFVYFVSAKEMNLQDPGLTFEVHDAGSGPVITIKSEKLARQVFLEAKGLDGRFLDNFFDMAPGETRVINYFGPADIKQLSETIIIKSIYDTYN